MLLGTTSREGENRRSLWAMTAAEGLAQAGRRDGAIDEDDRWDGIHGPLERASRRRIAGHRRPGRDRLHLNPAGYGARLGSAENKLNSDQKDR